MWTGRASCVTDLRAWIRSIDPRLGTHGFDHLEPGCPHQRQLAAREMFAGDGDRQALNQPLAGGDGRPATADVVEQQQGPPGAKTRRISSIAPFQGPGWSRGREPVMTESNDPSSNGSL